MGLSPQAEAGLSDREGRAAVDVALFTVTVQAVPDHDLLPVDVARRALELAVDRTVTDALAGLALLPGTTVVIDGALHLDGALVADFVVQPETPGRPGIAAVVEPFARIGLGVAGGTFVLPRDQVGHTVITETSHNAVRVVRAGHCAELVGAVVIDAAVPDRAKLHLEGSVTVVDAVTLPVLTLPSLEVTIAELALRVVVALRVLELVAGVVVDTGGDHAAAAERAVRVRLAVERIRTAVDGQIDGRRPVVDLTRTVRLTDRILEEDAAGLLVTPGVGLTVFVAVAVEAVILLVVRAVSDVTTIPGTGIAIVAAGVVVTDDVDTRVVVDPEPLGRVGATPGAGLPLVTPTRKSVGRAGLADEEALHTGPLTRSQGIVTEVAEGRAGAVRVGLTDERVEVAGAVEALVDVRTRVLRAGVDRAGILVVAVEINDAVDRRASTVRLTDVQITTRHTDGARDDRITALIVQSAEVVGTGVEVVAVEVRGAVDTADIGVDALVVDASLQGAVTLDAVGVIDALDRRTGSIRHADVHVVALATDSVGPERVGTGAVRVADVLRAGRTVDAVRPGLTADTLAVHAAVRAVDRKPVAGPIETGVVRSAGVTVVADVGVILRILTKVVLADRVEAGIDVVSVAVAVHRTGVGARRVASLALVASGAWLLAELLVLVDAVAPPARADEAGAHLRAVLIGAALGLGDLQAGIDLNVLVAATATGLLDHVGQVRTGSTVHLDDVLGGVGVDVDSRRLAAGQDDQGENGEDEEQNVPLAHGWFLRWLTHQVVKYRSFDLAKRFTIY